jgi:hypothetical protein
MRRRLEDCEGRKYDETVIMTPIYEKRVVRHFSGFGFPNHLQGHVLVFQKYYMPGINDRLGVA